MVQHQAAGAFKEPALRLEMTQVDMPPHHKAQLCTDLLDQVSATLAAPVGGEHRIQHHRAVGMKADPVVGEHRIGFGRPGRVIDHTDADAGGLELLHEGVKLDQRRPGRRPGAVCRLKRVGGCSLRVVAKVCRSHQAHVAAAGVYGVGLGADGHRQIMGL